MESVFLVTAIVGFVELLKAIDIRDWYSVRLIVGATLIGALCGFFGIDGLTIVSGIQAGLTASGTYRLTKAVGGN